MTTEMLDLDAQLVPDDQCWGFGFGDHDYPAETLDEIAGYLRETVQPGYRRRLHSTSPGYQPGDTRCVVPPGFDAHGHPNRSGVAPDNMDPEFVTSLDSPTQLDPDLQAHFRARGWALDQHGRPVHPLREQLLADPRIGLPTSLGYAYWHGEAAVVDAVVTSSSGRVLLTSRDTNQGTIPSPPGGYSIPADVGRTPAQWRTGDRPLTVDGLLTTAVRKVREETGVVVPRDAEMQIVRAIRPISSPHTLNAWTCTYTVRVALQTSPSPLRVESPVGWHDVDDVLDEMLPTMWPDHQRALLAAIE